MTTATPVPRQQLVDTTGRPFAYFVTADEMARLTAESERLRAEVEELKRQRGRLEADLERMHREFIPIPPTEEEWREAMANPTTLDDLLTQLGVKS